MRFFYRSAKENERRENEFYVRVDESKSHRFLGHGTHSILAIIGRKTTGGINNAMALNMPNRIRRLLYRTLLMVDGPPEMLEEEVTANRINPATPEYCNAVRERMSHRIVDFE